MALTGGAGSGKSRVAERLEQHGVPTIDTDELSREVVRPGQPGLQRLVERVGSWILDSGGQLDRERLRERMLVEPGLRETVEASLHPPILERMESRIAGLKAPYVVVEVPLLVESGLQDQFDCIVTVEAPEDERIRRLVERDRIDMAQAERLLRVQAGEEQRTAIADHVVHNQGELTALERAADQLHEKLQSAAAAHQ